MLVIVMGLRGMQIEQHAEEVIAYVGQLSKDFERFRGDFDTVGKHISHAQSQVLRRGPGVSSGWRRGSSVPPRGKSPRELEPVERPTRDRSGLTNGITDRRATFT